MDWKVSSRSGVSDSSRVREVGEMSVTLAPMISQMVIISWRVLLLALTFRSISSRPMRAFSSRVRTLMTSISLLSCFSTCSTTLLPLSTMMVMREMVGSSVTPTARDSMLKARRENRPVIRFSAPAWFSTRTEMVCFMASPPSLSRWCPHRGGPRRSAGRSPGRPGTGPGRRPAGPRPGR